MVGVMSPGGDRGGSCGGWVKSGRVGSGRCLVSIMGPVVAQPVASLWQWPAPPCSNPGVCAAVGGSSVAALPTDAFCRNPHRVRQLQPVRSTRTSGTPRSRHARWSSGAPARVMQLRRNADLRLKVPSRGNLTGLEARINPLDGSHSATYPSPASPSTAPYVSGP